jgi:uncharacterized protein involved in response to NO
MSQPAALREAEVERRRSRRRATAPILQNGFRPFFLGGALWLVFATFWWLHLFATGGGAGRFDPLAWHQHAMLFGGVGAIVAGFLLTAIPNWTGRLPVSGRALAALGGLWLAARAANLAGTQLPPWLPPVLDVGFFVVLAGVAGNEVVRGRNRRNDLVVGLVALFAGAALGSQLDALGGWAGGPAARRLAMAVVLVLIALIGGRIVPSFTRNWLVKRGAARLPTAGNGFDQATLVVLAVALAAWVVAPDAYATALLALGAGVLHALRLARWCGHATLAEPLVTVLHVGYAWLPVGMMLLGLERFAPALALLSAEHALAAGAIGTMTLAVMTRASLGHTGRRLTAGPATLAIYALVTLGALVRVAAYALPGDPLTALAVGGALWAGAFLLYALRYAPILVRPRAG